MPRRTVVANSSALSNYITIDQAAAALAVDHKTIRRKITAGELPAVRIGTRAPGAVRDTRPIRIDPAAVGAILEPMAEPSAALEQYIRRVVDGAPPLSPEQRDRLAGLLRNAS